MNPREKQDAEFDKLADAMIRRIERAVSTFDPDEVDVEMSGDVLNLTLGNGQKIVINRHRAARQIWMAAQRKAGHFDPDADGKLWKTADAELVSTLETVLSALLARSIRLGIS
ncbi:MAG TPA: iron donor protein CyaY [Pseudomonadota bacterium]|nr:iron donor protein CyaY [Pseudomonadota bacterium]